MERITAGQRPVLQAVAWWQDRLGSSCATTTSDVDRAVGSGRSDRSGAGARLVHAAEVPLEEGAALLLPSYRRAARRRTARQLIGSPAQSLKEDLGRRLHPPVRGPRLSLAVHDGHPRTAREFRR